MDVVEKAKSFAFKAHSGQKDDEGGMYVFHCEKVAEIVNTVTSDPEMIAAAWLHDTLEDTHTTHDDLKQEFGERIANLVYEVTHLGTKKTGYYFPNLKSRDAMLLKFADRLHNLSRMNSWDEERRAQYMRKSRFWRDQPPK